LRTKLVEDGHLPPNVEPILESLRSELNMMGEPRAKRGDWAKELEIKDLTRTTAKAAFHAGCRYAFDGELGGIARAAVAILKKADIDFGILGAEESCCGGRAFSMGFDDQLTYASSRLLKLWSAAGVETVVTPCADCYFAFKRLYAEHAGSTLRVIHMVELLDEFLRDGRLALTRPVPLRVTYHDPCHLGRQGEAHVPWKGEEKKIFGQAVCYDPPRPRYNGAFGVYDAPRNVLKAIPGLELVEMERVREAAWCCGAGGGARESYPDFSAWTAGERIEEAESTGADALVTACGWCERNFIDAVSARGGKLQVLDVLQLVEQAL
jgi:heterodisulfide reductase subunit D